MYKLLAQNTAKKISAGTLIHKSALKWKPLKILFSLFVLQTWWDYFTWMVSSFLILPERVWRRRGRKKREKKEKLLDFFKYFLTLKVFDVFKNN